MHYIASAVVLLTIPLFVSLLQSGERYRIWAYFGMGLLPFTVNAWNLDASLISWPAWQGQAKGLVITFLDTLALAILLTHRRPRGPLPIVWVLATYFVAVVMSFAVASNLTAAVFYAFQVLRMIVVVAAVAKITSDPRKLQLLALGLAAGITYQASVTVWQRAHGAFQTAGTLGHQNLLGLMSHFVMLPLLAILLGGMRNRLVFGGFVASVLVVALGASRGAIGFGFIGMVLVMILSTMRRQTPYKFKIIGLSVVALVVISPLIAQGLNKRLANTEIAGGSDERAAFERAATAMWHDHPYGVGANQYTLVANIGGYNERAGVIWNYTSRSAKVHNAYLLVAAETGWPGLLTFIAMLVVAVFQGFRFTFQDRRDPRGDVVLGCTIAILTTAGHNFYEWIFVTYQAQYVFAISVGIIAAMVRARATEKRVMRRPVPPSEEASAIGSTPGGMVTAQSIATR